VPKHCFHWEPDSAKAEEVGRIAERLRSFHAPDATDVFVYDILTGTNSLVSGLRGSTFFVADNYSDSPSISTDGSAIAFHSTAPNLVTGQSGPAGSNIFLFSTQSGSPSITLVSHAAGSPNRTASGNSMSHSSTGTAAS